MPEFVRSSVRLAALLALGASVAACGSFNEASRKFANSITPYKVEVVQGNVITKEQVDALQKGMSRQQVKDLMGTPLLASVFHANRWDYVFTIKRKGVPEQERRFTVFFNDTGLDRFEGDEMPSEQEFVASVTTSIKNPKVPRLEATPEELAKYKANQPAPATTPADTSSSDSSATPPASYPPLESPQR
ncbi:outer membrane protein assembly factor BamE [Comamonas sp. BIGb0152]|uniref:outer membrane protein assembly factor BamE n=1 Tax=Comamonas sp. BIGb0152 TaxID=2940601 RepID=UPI0021678A8B|nr:outer membrane protein assembly factor BamE [Comamonas sp. BIGb0152]MCS4296024.1 outer membrane protein assembly factor BamE [Comamonas sp. BIGb0152]